MTTPDPEVLDAITGPTTRVLRRVDIYEQDGITEYLLDAPLVSGSVSADANRDERRSFELVLFDLDGSLQHDPEYFWYDKILKVFRGVVDTDGVDWYTQVGEFRIDNISSDNFPGSLVHVSGRDYVSMLTNAKFRYSTKFISSQTLEEVVQAIAFAAGIRNFDLPVTGIVLDLDVIFERETVRWTAIKNLCTAKGYDVYFRPDGYMTMTEFVDPTTTPSVYTFATGDEGVVVKYNKTATNARAKNVIVVSGESTDTIPVTYIAENHVIGSPTSVEEIGERTDFITSPLIETDLQAQDLADKILAVSSLEEYTITFESLVLPWLDVGVIVDIPSISEASPHYTSKYLLSTLTIPLGLSGMASTGKRVVLV